MYLKVKKPYGNELKPILENTSVKIQKTHKKPFTRTKNSQNFINFSLKSHLKDF